MMGAVGAAVKIAARFDTVPNDLATTVFTDGSKGVNCAFETIEIMGDAVHKHLQGLVVIVATNFASHNKSYA